jgi:SPP1 family predicted phage head-tail adaptor
MKKSDVAYLVSESWTQDNTGVQRRSTEKRKVFVKVSSVTSQEWFEGGRNGLNPQYRFTMFQFDYLGEKIIEYNGVSYTIYRTFNKSVDEIELYVELKKGNDVEESQSQ